MKMNRIMLVLAILLSAIVCSCGSSNSRSAGYYTDGKGNHIIVYADNTWEGKLTEYSPAGMDITYNYTGIVDDKNMLIIKTGETRRVMPGGDIAELGNSFGVIEGDHIRGGMRELNTIWTKDEMSSKFIPTKYKLEITPSGLKYAFTALHEDNPQIKPGDVAVGTIVVRFNEEIIQQQLKAERIALVSESQNGNINEGLLMMHIGDRATFEIDADKVCQEIGADKMPPSYKQGEGMRFIYTIQIFDIITKEEIEVERKEFEQSAEGEYEKEQALIAEYVEKNNIKETPLQSGLYRIIKKNGSGMMVLPGNKVSIKYVGRFLDGTEFDRSGNDPFTYVVGQTSLIKGWEEGLAMQTAGTELTLIMPSSLAYGKNGVGVIPPYTPLVFDIKIISVK